MNNSNFNLTRRTMNAVVQYEKKRTIMWFIKNIFLLVISLIIAIGSFRIVMDNWKSQQTLDVLTIFQEDAEIIQDYWQDTILTFWEETPQEELVGTLAIIAGIFVIIFLQRRRLRQNIIKLKNVVKFPLTEK